MSSPQPVLHTGFPAADGATPIREVPMDDMLLMMTLASCTATVMAVRLWQWLEDLAQDDHLEESP